MRSDWNPDKNMVHTLIALGAFLIFATVMMVSIGGNGQYEASGDTQRKKKTKLPVVSITAIDTEAIEPPYDDGAADEGVFRLRRAGGNLSKALPVKLHFGGDALSGRDYKGLLPTQTIVRGSDGLSLDVTPKWDNELEGSETVTVTILPDRNYRVDAERSSVTLTIVDHETAR